MLPSDIIQAIEQNAKNDSEKEELIQLCTQIKSMILNVGHEPLIRCALLICNFSPIKLKHLILNNFEGDPRDVIMHAQKINPQINYGLNTFENL